MSENEIVNLLFGDKSFSKDMNFRVITSSIRFIKDSNIKLEYKIENIFSPSVSMFYVIYLL